MNYQVKHSINTVEEIKDYWRHYVQLLGSLLIQKHLALLSELLSMAITDFEPNEAAAIVLIISCLIL
jgi:hypothetical protein